MIQLTYKILKAHTSGPALKETEVLKDVANFLKKKGNPYNYDVNVELYDGQEWEIVTYTGDDILAEYEKMNVVESI